MAKKLRQQSMTYLQKSRTAVISPDSCFNDGCQWSFKHQTHEYNTRVKDGKPHINAAVMDVPYSGSPSKHQASSAFVKDQFSDLKDSCQRAIVRLQGQLSRTVVKEQSTGFKDSCPAAESYCVLAVENKGDRRTSRATRRHWNKRGNRQG